MTLELNEEAWTDFQILINMYLDASEKILQKDKYLVPIAAFLNDGQPQFQAISMEDTTSGIDTKEHLTRYRKYLSNMPENTQACILGYDIKIQYENYNDAIAIELQHSNGTHQKMFVPYRFSGLFKNKLEMGQSKLVEGSLEPILNSASNN